MSGVYIECDKDDRLVKVTLSDQAIDVNDTFIPWGCVHDLICQHIIRVVFFGKHSEGNPEMTSVPCTDVLKSQLLEPLSGLIEVVPLVIALWPNNEKQ